MPCICVFFPLKKGNFHGADFRFGGTLIPPLRASPAKLLLSPSESALTHMPFFSRVRHPRPGGTHSASGAPFQTTFFPERVRLSALPPSLEETTPSRPTFHAAFILQESFRKNPLVKTQRREALPHNIFRSFPPPLGTFLAFYKTTFFGVFS